MPKRQRLTVDQESFLLVRSFACDYSSGAIIESHHHSWGQLLYASAGSMSVRAEHQTWLIPPGKAVFLPAGSQHSIRMWGQVKMRSLAFPTNPTHASLAASGCRVLSVSPLFREVILRIVDTPALDSRSPTHQRLFGVLADEMNAAAIEPLTLPLPTDTRAGKVALRLLDAPASPQTLEQCARSLGVGSRTLERLFRAETGMSFGLWRQKARMVNSVRLLSEGYSVTLAALDSGYVSLSAFIAAFKRTFGCTPGKI